ncbi:hypothetical protein EJ05DRAFT_510819 [Pseudovirgaria hyperparasitica]|uniref:DUF7730 domain-containing protein n=1 Tax=Pseudovirgaria hyperparasitica TaxID=470096 RepID=A0A6A6W6Y1_9PEZI|nr:uncharacterized protein EJ05DRAFT_510819 [Pseudovirgaria hyperparasitica]KAF2757959.1 hypothetical protein EJ05DRAFT_510819 [Pseudovirgaria hyperparasitica]
MALRPPNCKLTSRILGIMRVPIDIIQSLGHSIQAFYDRFQTRAFAEGVMPPPGTALSSKRKQPRKRKRKLSITSTQQLKRTNPQKSSPLFQKLPPEVRNQIWFYALGNRRLHFRLCNGKLIAGVCQNVYDPVLRETKQACKLGFLCVFDPAGLSFLPILQTCRRVYHEAIPHVYGSNHIEFWDYWFASRAVSSLPKAIIPNRLANIRHVTFKWDSINLVPKYNPGPEHAWRYVDEHWVCVWRAFGRMPNLDVLRVRLCRMRLWGVLDPEGYFTDSEDDMLLPLKAVQTRKVFEVLVSWPLKENARTRHEIKGVVRQLPRFRRGGRAISAQ